MGLAAGGLAPACARRRTHVLFYRAHGYSFSSSERRTIGDIAEASAIQVASLLPGLPAHITIRVEAGTRVIPETGEGGSAHPPDVVYWTVDPRRRDSVGAIAARRLRGTLFHEFCHLVRERAAPGDRRLIDEVIGEGLATAFERIHGGADAPWGDYPPEVGEWVEQIAGLGPDASRDHWMFRHPDGRRWIGYKAGTYLVDLAHRRSRRPVTELVTVPTDDLLRLAGR
jgi:hypothetical protein